MEEVQAVPAAPQATADGVVAAPDRTAAEEKAIAAATPPKTVPAPDRTAELAALAAAHARAHKRLTVIETIGTALLVFAVLAALTSWVYYEQAHKSSQPFSSNEYQQ